MKKRATDAGKRTFNDAMTPLSSLAAASTSARLDSVFSTILRTAADYGMKRGVMIGERAERAVLTALTARMITTTFLSTDGKATPLSYARPSKISRTF